MEKPFTLKVNDLHQDIVNLLNEAKMPCYVLKTVINEIIKEIDDADATELTKYFNETKKEKESEE